MTLRICFGKISAIKTLELESVEIDFTDGLTYAKQNKIIIIIYSAVDLQRRFILKKNHGYKMSL